MKMTSKRLKNYSLRIDADLLEKFHYVVESEGRSVNSHLTLYIRRCVASYEEKYGPIPLSQGEGEE